MASKKMKVVRDLLTVLVEKTIELVHDQRKTQEEKDIEILTLIDSTSKKIVREEKKKEPILDNTAPKNKGQKYTKEEIKEMFRPLIEEERRLRQSKKRKSSK